MTLEHAVVWSERLIALALLLQSFEMIQIKQVMSESGVWAWSLVQEEFTAFSRPLRWLLRVSLQYPNIVYLLWLRCGAALTLVIYPHPLLLVFLLISSVFLSMRFRGTFNGGSDSMTIIILGALLVAEVFQTAQRGALYYVAIQTTLSYCIAGIVKVREPSWRNGAALQGFLQISNFNVPSKIQRLFQNRMLACVGSWSVILFECLFPIAFLSSKLAIIFLAMGLLFHFINIYVFGLNRFFFVWAAAYPAIWYCAQS